MEEGSLGARSIKGARTLYSNEIAEVEEIPETEEFNRVFENQYSDDQVCPYKCPSCTLDQWRTVDIVEGGGPSSLGEKFSNGTSTMDIDDRHFDYHDSDDEADNHLPKVSTILVRLLSRL
ncbi:Uncharacterized protein Fot_33561 [Forsythia ovata]|uniref:Uncharacterized protein n=1 Tax=Forsythia ovata TaxID=205694 RepID=A0ABD1TB17_9LAMI